jgi:2-polyprenyl-3-methyl-5-hydroxy-6-metoxy-1,4-benzoquinol methylase
MPPQPGYVDADYLRQAGELLAPIKQRSHELMSIQPGHRVLDMGCGPGLDTLLLAAQVGPQGEVLGIDSDAEMVADAEAAARQAGVQDWVSHRVGDAAAPGLDPGHFDAIRSERLFMHLSDPETALHALIAATRSGGRVVVADPDWGSLSIDSTNLEVERALARCRAEQCLNNGYSGRRLRGQFLRAGLLDVSVEAHPVVMTDYGLARFMSRLDDVEHMASSDGWISPRQLADWHDELESASKRGCFFGATTIVIVAGRVP